MKSQTSRGWGTLRRILADSGKDPGPGPRGTGITGTGTTTDTGTDYLRAEW
ncbi:hypothetical protein ACRAWF_28265 [Streptomyces sp. L7]